MTEKNTNSVLVDPDVIISNAETGEMAKWLLGWKIGGASNYAVFYLPEGVNPTSIGWTGTLLNLVALTADGHKYTIKEIP